jgi:dihydrodipicolinate reductase
MAFRVCVAGVSGWTGSAVARAVLASDAFELTGAVARRQAGRDAGELLGLPATALAEVGGDHRLADPERLAAMLRACGQVAAARRG